MKSNKQRLMDAFCEYYPLLRKVALSRVHTLDAAYDVLQNLAIKLIELDRDLEIREYKAYLKTCVRHASYDYLRSENRYVPMEAEQLDQFASEGFEELVSNREALTLLKEYFSTVSPELREAWARWVFDGHTIEQIASDMGIKPATLRQQFHRLRKKMPPKELLLMLILLLNS